MKNNTTLFFKEIITKDFHFNSKSPFFYVNFKFSLIQI